MVARSLLLVVLFGSLAACAHGRSPAVGTTTTTAAKAPMVPDQPLSPALLEETEEEKQAAAAEAAAAAPETWGVRPPTQEQLDKYGF